jgi:hypothetical protein
MRIFTDTDAQYLKSPILHFELATLIILAIAFTVLTNSYPYKCSGFIVLFLGASVVSYLFHAPRWVTYMLILTATILYMSVYILIIAEGGHDWQSTRDDALEATATNLLHGKNPWQTSKDLVPTTGPTSILIALPFVALCGKVNVLSLIVWITFISILLYWDIKKQNEVWPVLCGLIISGVYGFEHTLFWGLDELYYPFIYLAIAYLFACRGRWFAVGALYAAAILSRPCFLFPVFGFFMWDAFRPDFTLRKFIHQIYGGIFAAGIILLPIVLVDHTNPLTYPGYFMSKMKTKKRGE